MVEELEFRNPGGHELVAPRIILICNLRQGQQHDAVVDPFGREVRRRGIAARGRAIDKKVVIGPRCSFKGRNE